MQEVSATPKRLLGALALCLLFACAPAAAARTAVGYNEDPERLVSVPKAVLFSNTEIARINWSWWTIEPADDWLMWWRVDRVVNLLRSAGIRPMITIWGTPRWAGGHDDEIRTPDDDQAWEELWQEVAQRYPDAILNIWNEPNHPFFGPVDVDRMAELVNEAAWAIWEVAPQARVVGPPMSPAGDWARYAGAFYSQLDPAIDMAVNVYPYEPMIKNLREDLWHARRIANGRPIWITETNVSRAQVGVRQQQRYVRAVYALARKWRFKSLIFHRLWSPFASTADSWDAGLSALRCDGSPRPLFGQIGRLNPGFRPLSVAPPEAGGPGIVVSQPPPPERPPDEPTPTLCPDA